MAKNIIAALMLAAALLCSVNLIAANKHSKTIYQEYKHQNGLKHFSLSSRLVRSMLWGKDNRDTRRLLKNVRKLRMLVYEGGRQGKELQESMTNTIISKGYKELMVANEAQEKVSIKLLEDDNNIKELFIIITEGDELIFDCIEGKIPVADGEELVNCLKRNDTYFAQK